MKRTVLAILAAACCVLLVGCHSSVQEGAAGSSTEEPISGGVTDHTDSSAPKTITSKDIESYYASFCTYDENHEYDLSEYTFKVEKDSAGEMILTAACNFYSNELEMSADDMAGLQAIIDKYELAKDNGTDKITAGLPPECGPCKMKVMYASGEKLYFRYDGDMEDSWIRETKQYLEGLMENAGLDIGKAADDGNTAEPDNDESSDAQSGDRDLLPDDIAEMNENSMNRYKRFLEGKEKLDISRVDLKADASELYKPELKADETYTIDEFLTKFFTDRSGYNDGDYYVNELYYGYTDCGLDDLHELVLQFKSYMYNDEYNNIMVIKDIDDQLVLCTWVCDGYRSYNYINTYGVVAEGGSGGASDQVAGYYGIDENGDRYVIYESETCGAYNLYLGMDRNPGEEAEKLGADDICVTRYSFEAYPYDDYEDEHYLEYLKGNYYTYGKGIDSDNVDESPELYKADSKYAKFMDGVTDNWYTPDEMQEILDDKLAEYGLKEQQLEESELEFTKWEGHEEVFADFCKPVETIEVENPGWTYYTTEYPYEEKEDFVTLEEISHEANKTWDETAWMEEIGAENPFSEQMDVIEDPSGKYTYHLSSTYGRYSHFYDTVIIHDNETNEDVVKLDFLAFITPDEYVEKEAGYISECVEYVETVGDVVYVSIAHRTYAASAPHNAYVMALDKNDGYRVIWKSEPLVANSCNFAIVDGSIICGYGFTDEPDYIYELNRYTGEKMETIKVKSGPDYFFVVNGKLYVRTYDTSYVYQLNRG